MISMSTTMPIKRILVATDGSESSDAAVDMGVGLAAAEHAHVVFLHVRPPASYRYSRLAPASAIPRKLGSAAQDDALQRAATVAREAGVSAQVELIAGDAAREITSVAEIVDADLVVVGRGSRNPFHEHVGSSVVRRTKRPVLVAKRRPEADAKTGLFRRAA
jgi:nucleotide-binding universal stress UspA family protein